MKKLGMTLILTAIFLSACNMPGPSLASPTVSQDLVATQVANILTAAPATIEPGKEFSTQQPPALPSETAEPVAVATLTPAPTQAQSPTLAPTTAAQPTQTTEPPPAPTVTIPSSDPRLSLGTPTWTDDFTSDANWPTGEDKFTGVEVKDGYLKLTSKENIDGWRLAYPDLEDFYLEATVKSEDCSGTDHYGMIFRVPDKEAADSGYLFGITCEGKYALRKWDGEKMTNLIPWTSSTAVLAGSNQVNRLGVMAKGSKLAVYVNGTLLNQVEDTSFSEGAFGLFVGSNKTHDVTVSVDQVSYWSNP